MLFGNIDIEDMKLVQLQQIVSKYNTDLILVVSLCT